MSDRNPNFHSRRSIRLKGYDYSRAGLYFITLCVQNRERLFGEIRPVEVPVEVPLRGHLEKDNEIPKDDRESNISKGDHAGSPPQRQQMILNDAGKMIGKWYAELENKFPNIRCHEMVVMPNHFHCILEIVKDHSISKDDQNSNISKDDPAWSSRRGSPRQDESTTDNENIIEIAVGATLRGRPNNNSNIDKNDQPNSPYGLHNKKYNPVIGEVVGWFKTMTTNEYIRRVKSDEWKAFYGKLWQRDYWEHIVRDEVSLYRIAHYINSNPENWKEDQLNA